jgi:four helix bundle protein
MFEIYKTLLVDYKYPLGSNLIRAAMSIANNLAEGSGKKSKREKSHYYGISFDSARECVSVLNVFKRQKLIDIERYLKLRKDSREITSMLRGLIDSL